MHQQERRGAAVLGLLAVAAVSFFINFFADFWNSWSCSLGFDTSTVPAPADGSPQGWLCGEHASSAGTWIFGGGYLLSFVLTVLLVALAWRRWSWRAGVPALLLVVALPWAATTLLNLPSDNCTASARASHPRWACDRSM